MNTAATFSRFGTVSAIRSFFTSQGFSEVNTPVLIESPFPEPHIDAIKTEGGFFRTSPEMHMKILLSNAVKPDGTDMFKDVDEARFYMLIKTGNVEHMIVDNIPVIKVKSMAFDEMAEDEFQELFNSSIDVILRDCLPGTDREALVNEIISFAG